MENQVLSSKSPQVLILGVGNILMGDEGIGVRVVERFREIYDTPEGVEVVDGGTLGFELLGFLENKDLVIIVDAFQKKGTHAGEVVLIDLDKEPNFYRDRISPHQIGISDLLNLAFVSNSMPNSIKLVGIVPYNIDPGLELSKEALEGVEKAIIVIKNLLTDLGIKLLTKTN